MKCFSLLLAAMLLTAFTSPAFAQVVVFSDDFSEADGTPLHNKVPDVGAAWNIAATRGNGQRIIGGVVDTFTNPNTDTPTSYGFNGDFTTALSAGNVLRLSFSTVASGGPFHGGNFAGINLNIGNTSI